jgi:hypothetical protein
VIRLYILVEGPTEERFVKNVLGPHLNAQAIWTHPIIVATRRDRRTGQKSRGGGHWKHWRNDLRRLTAEHTGADVRFTTLFDLYGLPDDFPDLTSHQSIPDTKLRVSGLETALAAAIGDHRLIPYLQRHEFEALVLACLASLRTLLEPSDHAGWDQLAASLKTLAPEDINDGEQTAPSKRLQATLRLYEKTTHGPLAIEATGIAVVRAQCPRFDAWVTRLEGLSDNAAP